MKVTVVANEQEAKALAIGRDSHFRRYVDADGFLLIGARSFRTVEGMRVSEWRATDAARTIPEFRHMAQVLEVSRLKFLP